MKNKTKKFCRKCNKEYPITAKYCPKCSEPLSDIETEIKKFCNKCNKEYPLNHTYCFDCGERLSNIENKIKNVVNDMFLPENTDYLLSAFLLAGLKFTFEIRDRAFIRALVKAFIELKKSKPEELKEKYLNLVKSKCSQQKQFF